MHQIPLNNIFRYGLPSVKGILFDYLDLKWSLKKHTSPVWEMIYVDQGKVKLEIGKSVYQGGR